MNKLLISSRSANGFRRCGIEFGPEKKEVSLDGLTPEQVETLRNEPNLVVHEVSAAADIAEEGKKGSSAEMRKLEAELEKVKQEKDALDAKVTQLKKENSELKEELKAAAKAAAEAEKAAAKANEKSASK